MFAVRDSSQHNNRVVRSTNPPVVTARGEAQHDGHSDRMGSRSVVASWIATTKRWQRAHSSPAPRQSLTSKPARRSMQRPGPGAHPTPQLRKIGAQTNGESGSDVTNQNSTACECAQFEHAKSKCRNAGNFDNHSPLALLRASWITENILKSSIPRSDANAQYRAHC